MRNKFLLLLISAFLFLININKAQTLIGKDAEKQFKNSSKVILKKNCQNPVFIQFSKDNYINVEDINLKLKEALKISELISPILISQETDIQKNVHYKYQQYFNGIPINDAYYTVHSQNNKVYSVSGIINSSIKTENMIIMEESSALGFALASINSLQYKWQSNSDELLLKEITGNQDATYYPKAVKTIFHKGDKYYYTFKFDIYSNRPLTRPDVFVDAQTGAILGMHEKIQSTDVSGTAKTRYSGTRNITCNNISSVHILHESGRGNGIMTFNLMQGDDFSLALDFENNSCNWDITNANKDEAALDAHWAMESYYDYLKNTFGRNSLNNNGMFLISFVHFRNSYLNAFWDGACMTFGDGSSTNNFNPLTSLDVCGHEMTHGLINYTADLIYDYQESGALNEGFADIFGHLLKFYAKPESATWEMGTDMNWVIRSAQNPNAYNDPDTYHGQFWDPLHEMHRNSTVLSYWFYLLCMGGNGTNDNGNQYELQGIGIEKSQIIAYELLSHYLTPNSEYIDAYNFSLTVVADLYGMCSPEYLAVQKAWYAVGIGQFSTQQNVINITATNTNICKGDPIILNASGATDYCWYPISTLSSSSGASVTAVPEQTTTYTINGTNGIECLGSNSITINVINGNPINFSPAKAEICIGDTISITANDINNCAWTAFNSAIPSQNNIITVQPNITTIYNVSGKIGNCNIEENYTVKVNPKPIAYFNISTDSPNGKEHIISFRNQSKYSNTYNWFFGETTSYLNNSIDENPKHSYSDEGDYLVTLIANSGVGCSDTLSTSIHLDPNTQFFAPNAFAPESNSSENNKFVLSVAGYYPNTYNLKIFNRSGQLMFYSNDPDNSWDGTYKGNIVSGGVYTWTAEFRSLNGGTFARKGIVTVIR